MPADEAEEGSWMLDVIVRDKCIKARSPRRDSKSKVKEGPTKRRGAAAGRDAGRPAPPRLARLRRGATRRVLRSRAATRPNASSGWATWASRATTRRTTRAGRRWACPPKSRNPTGRSSTRAPSSRRRGPARLSSRGGGGSRGACGVGCLLYASILFVGVAHADARRAADGRPDAGPAPSDGNCHKDRCAMARPRASDADERTNRVVSRLARAV